MNKMKWIIFAIIVIGVFGAVIMLNKNDAKTFTGDAKTITTQGPIADHVFGPATQKVTLIEYGDFQCPSCGVMFQPVQTITTQYKDKLTFVFRNFPLTTVHPNALAAATAAEAAGLQTKYWQMHDALYANQNEWASVPVDQRQTFFEAYAQQLGLDVNKFKKDLASKDISDKIALDRSSSAQFSVDQTPTFILNGKKIDTSVATNGDNLRRAIEDALKAAYPGFAPVPASGEPVANQNSTQ